MGGAVPETIRRWHGVALDARDAPMGDWRERLGAILADDCVFESPVVHTPQAGRAIVEKYLLGALSVLNTPAFCYGGEWFADRSAVLEFYTEIDGVKINGVDIISWNDEGRITHFKVMLRPLKAINMVHQKMGEFLMGKAGPG